MMKPTGNSFDCKGNGTKQAPQQAFAGPCIRDCSPDEAFVGERSFDAGFTTGTAHVETFCTTVENWTLARPAFFRVALFGVCRCHHVRGPGCRLPT